MLKGVHRNYNVRSFFRRRREATKIVDARALRLPLCRFKNIVADIDADHAPGASFSHLDGIGPFAATEVDDNFPRNPGQEVIPQQNLKLRLVLVSAPATAIRGSGRNLLKDSILEVGEHCPRQYFASVGLSIEMGQRTEERLNLGENYAWQTKRRLPEKRAGRAWSPPRNFSYVITGRENESRQITRPIRLGGGS
jgi:hypothetical protein